MPSSFCWYCGAEAHWICDYTLPQAEWKQGIPWCERPTCKAHGVSVAQGVQYCKEHAEAGIVEHLVAALHAELCGHLLSWTDGHARCSHCGFYCGPNPTEQVIDGLKRRRYDALWSDPVAQQRLMNGDRELGLFNA